MVNIDAISINPTAALLIGLLMGQLIGIASVSVSSGGMFAKAKEDTDKQTIYIGNLPFRATRAELGELFLPFGKVHSTRIMIDKVTRKPRGYGFVEMDSKNATKAINQLDGTTFIGRNIRVSEANQRDSK